MKNEMKKGNEIILTRIYHDGIFYLISVQVFIWRSVIPQATFSVVFR